MEMFLLSLMVYKVRTKKKSIFLREMQFYIYLVKYDSKIIV